MPYQDSKCTDALHKLLGAEVDVAFRRKTRPDLSELRKQVKILCPDVTLKELRKKVLKYK